MRDWLVTYRWPDSKEYGPHMRGKIESQEVEADTAEHAAWEVRGGWKEEYEPELVSVDPA